MGYHWDVSLEIQCGNKEEASSLYSYLEKHNLNDDTVSFKTDGFDIAGNNFYFDVYEDKISIGDETHSRDIGTDNIHKFLKELDNIAKKANSTIQNVILKFFPQENQGFYVFVKKLPPKAFDKFIKECIVEFDESAADDKEYVADYKKELKQAIKEYKKVHWVIVCEHDDVEKLIKNDPDGRECLWEFDEELSSWADKIISDFEFPWKEGCTMWIGAVDKDGEMIWDNQ